MLKGGFPAGTIRSVCHVEAAVVRRLVEILWQPFLDHLVRWLPRGRHRPSLQGREVEASVCEPRVLPDFGPTPLLAQPVLLIHDKQLLDEVLDEYGAGGQQLFRDASRLTLADRQYLGHGVDRCLVVPRNLAGDELEGQHAKRPPVHHPVVGMRGVDHLGRHVLRRSNQRVGLAEDEAREAQVADLRVAPRVKEQVLRLQISVHDVPLVEVIEGQGHASRIEHGGGPARGVLLQDLPVVGHHPPEVATTGKLHKHVHVLRVLVGPEKSYNEVAVDHGKDIALSPNLLLHLGFDDVSLRHPLQGILLRLVFHQEDTCEAALAKHGNLVQLFKRNS
mmetsp:Transcript_60576/g.136336  ORF Transcript_60576/g.136336 Transcript_60576/m.136336 type:complete len:334 (+) Transcript_60576:92-1093(+)